MRIVIGMKSRGRAWPMGWASRVPTIAQASTGTRLSRVRRATPVWPLYTRPAVESGVSASGQGRAWRPYPSVSTSCQHGRWGVKRAHGAPPVVDTLFVAARPVVRQPRAGDETGSSLIELAVVIVIMAVLM